MAAHAPVWPWDGIKLVPPASHDNGHVEPHDEGQGYQVSEGFTVQHNVLKQPANKQITINKSSTHNEYQKMELYSDNAVAKCSDTKQECCHLVTARQHL